MTDRCDDCAWSDRCRWLLCDSYSPEGPCDWTPSRWRAPQPLDPPEHEPCHVEPGVVRLARSVRLRGEGGAQP